ncbi:MAG: IPT/TIG domain-containing protein [Chloroflexi bacterium]|nr:IPT/TIG domain-containing protein [Chloroflexota bacterium]
MFTRKEEKVVDCPAFRVLRQAVRISLIVFLVAMIFLAIAPTPVHGQGPELTIIPSSGTTGSIVTITGTGFKRGLLVTVTMDSFVMASGVEVGANDTFSVTREVPRLPYGEKTVTATVEGRVWASRRFDILAQIRVAPSSGLPGSTITITGTGFPPRSSVTITMDGREVVPGNISTDAAGTFSATGALPPLPPGQKTVVTTAGRVSTSTLFAVLPTAPTPQAPQVDINPHGGAPGSTVTIEGAGFPPSSSVTITMDGTTVAKDVVIDRGGAFSTPVIVPQLPPGRKTVVATAGTTRASTSFEVSPVATSPEPPPRLSWYWMILILGLLGALSISLWKIIPRPQPIQVRPHKDVGTQAIESDTPFRLDHEIRLKAALDPGRQDVEADGPLIIEERSEPHG